MSGNVDIPYEGFCKCQCPVYIFNFLIRCNRRLGGIWEDDSIIDSHYQVSFVVVGINLDTSEIF